MNIKVEFIETKDIENCLEEILKFNNPHIIIWYIGCNGLKKEGSEFYKYKLITPICKIKPNSRFWLIDLTAWGAFKGSKNTINKESSCNLAIKNLQHPSFHVLSSQKIFKRMLEIEDSDLADLLKNILKKKSWESKSFNHPDCGVKVKEIFELLNLAPDFLMEYDLSKAYSKFQYLEALLLIEALLISSISSGSKEKQIVFALPNDELEYYKDEHQSFEKDLQSYLNQSNLIKTSQFQKIEVKFISFSYGSDISHRPYNAPGKKIKPHQLKLETLLGES